MHLPPLPIHDILPELKTVLARGSAVLTAPPGSGKTTIIPLALLDAPWLAQRKILMLEPRRLAARAAAGRMAHLLGELVGQTVGYRIRFDRKISPATRIEVLTEGMLTRGLQNDAALKDTGLIIFDEFHERSVHADLALALCLDLCQLRDDLRLLVMSATLETAPLAALLGNVAVITGHGQSHEVRIDYLEGETPGDISTRTAKGINRVIREQQSDILAFLPGAGEINQTRRLLESDPATSGILILPLFGDLDHKNQDRALLPDPHGRRRVILATSIAETSLTLEGIGAVVDSGWTRRPCFDPGSGLSRLNTIHVSLAAARQRAGRAGRLGPGYCLRLWTKARHHSLTPFHPPEIVDADLADLVLELALWGVSDPLQLRWIDPPRPGPFQQARELLHSLGALNGSGRITAVGRQLAALPLHPRLGHMLLMAGKTGNIALACDLAALLTERDLIRRDSNQVTADLGTRLRMLEVWRVKGDDALLREGGDPLVCRRIDRATRQWLHLGNKTMTIQKNGRDPYACGTLLVHAYPDRIARRRAQDRGRYLLASGRGALLPPADPLAGHEYLVVPFLDGGRHEARIFLAEPLDLTDLKKHHPHLFSESRQIQWDDAAAKVVATRRLKLGEIVLEEQPLPDVDAEVIRQTLLNGIRGMGPACLPWNRESRQIQARIHFLRTWQPEADWPDLRDEQLLADLSWLEPYLHGINKAEQLKRIDLQTVFESLLGWERQQRLTREAPGSITVPSGSKIRIEYRLDAPPVLAVRIQEMFGLGRTPVLCGGKVALLLHLLSPAHRPIQITSDLAGFWHKSYPEIKKELKGRYPKHFWPDDPLRADATRGVKRKP